MADDAAEEEMTEAAEEEMTPWYDTGVVWYGSLRGAVVMGGAADDARTIGGGSRWGIKGTSEVSEGLTAVYKFETRLDEDAAQSGNQIYAGLSGGFGSLTIGKFDNAANLAGVIRNQGNAFGGSDVMSKVGNTVSYGYSNEAFTLQADAIMDKGTDTGKAIDQVQFGLAVNLGDVGTVAIGYEKAEDTMKTTQISAMHDKSATATSDDVPVMEITVSVLKEEGSANYDDDKKLTVDGKNAIVKTPAGKYTVGNVAPCAGDATKCLELTALVHRMTEMDSITNNADGTTTIEPGSEITETFYLFDEDKYTPATSKSESNNDGYKASHISAAFGLGAMTARLGYTSKDSNDPMHKMKKKITFVGGTGNIGETGMNWLAYGRKVEGFDGKETNPWGLGVGKALGGGAYAYIEHENADDGNSGSTQIGLNVDF